MMTTRGRSLRADWRGWFALIVTTALSACSLIQAPGEEEAIARAEATQEFKRKTGCSDAKTTGQSVETHSHPRWIGRESLRIYAIEIQGCKSKTTERIACSEERGCNPER